MIVFGRESVKNTAGEIKQNMGASPAYAYLAGLNFTRAALFDIGALVLSGVAQHMDSHFATAMNSMKPGTMPSLTSPEIAVVLGSSALLTVGGVSGVAGLVRGAESIVASPGQFMRNRRKAASAS